MSAADGFARVLAEAGLALANAHFAARRAALPPGRAVAKAAYERARHLAGHDGPVRIPLWLSDGVPAFRIL